MARQGMIEYRKAFSMPPKFFVTNDALYFFFLSHLPVDVSRLFVIAVRKIDKPQSIFFTGILFKNQGILQSLGVV